MPLNEKYKSLIYANIPKTFDGLPFHRQSPYIERFVAEDYPIHLAIHKVSDAQGQFHRLIEPHVHEAPEINILIGDDVEIEYELILGDECYQVRSPASIWIPAGLAHCANVIKGSGYCICLILSDTCTAFHHNDDSRV